MLRKNLILFCGILFLYFSLLFITAQSNQPAQPAQQPSEFYSPGEIIFDPIKNLFANWESGNLSVNIAKYLFFVLIAIFTWSLIDFSGLLPSQILSWIVAGIIAFLSIAYVAPAQVWVLMRGFDAYGLTITFFIPLIALGLFTLRVADHGSVNGIIAQRIIWGVYAVFLVWSFVTGILNNEINMQDPFSWIYLVMVGIIILIVIFNTTFIRALSNMEREAEVERGESITRKAVRYDRLRAGALDELSGSKRSSRFKLN
ncbi:MAG: hypothetical protein RL557_785 [archaeon]